MNQALLHVIGKLQAVTVYCSPSKAPSRTNNIDSGVGIIASKASFCRYTSGTATSVVFYANKVKEEREFFKPNNEKRSSSLFD